MRLREILLLLTILTQCGCMIKHLDLMSEFLIQGDVFDKATDKPLDNVKVIFIDTGFDSKRSWQRIPKEIGKSDNLGRIDLTFNYWWGYEQGLFKSKTKETFDIEVFIEKYKSEKFSFKASDLVRTNGKVQVPLGRIYMGQ